MTERYGAPRFQQRPAVVLTRRAALLGLTGAVGVGHATLALATAQTEQRLVVVILRGAMDGLAAVVPYGDPALADLRPDAPDTRSLLDLGGFFGLHPALGNLHAMYAAGEFLPVHAVAGPTRVRSHFEAQDCLESGADHRMTSGWLNRVAAALPQRAGRHEAEALAVGVSVPLLLRGPAEVANWAPRGTASLQADLYDRIAALNAADPITGPAIVEGIRARGFSDVALALAEVGDAGAGLGGDAGSDMGSGGAMRAGGQGRESGAGAAPGAGGASGGSAGAAGAGPRSPARYAFPALAEAAGRMLAAPDGPRLAALEIGGWDTHTAQAQRLGGPLRQLDAGLAALKSGLGQAWRQTAVLVMTEFGRTVRLNGTGGTDHGTATVAFVLGGSVNGGRVVSTWPGIAAGKLLEDRDLAPTMDLRSIVKGLIVQQFGLSSSALAEIFPASAQATPTSGLLRA